MNEKEGQIALFMNVLQERQQQILQAQRQIINYHLGRDFVARHLHNNLAKCRYSRATQDTADRPSFFFISEISSSVYDRDKKKIFNGKWYIPHEQVVESAGISKHDVLSCNIICLRALPQVKIIIFDTTKKLSSADLKVMNEAGYLVMDETYRWMVLDSSSPKGILRLNSPISPDTK